MIIAEFSGKDAFAHRTANIEHHGKEGAYLVAFMEHGKLVDRSYILGHTLRYAEDAAENFVLGHFVGEWP